LAVVSAGFLAKAIESQDSSKILSVEGISRRLQ